MKVCEEGNVDGEANERGRDACSVLGRLQDTVGIPERALFMNRRRRVDRHAVMAIPSDREARLQGTGSGGPRPTYAQLICSSPFLSKMSTHHASFSTYHLTVSSSATPNSTEGTHPSSRSSFSGLMT